MYRHVGLLVLFKVTPSKIWNFWLCTFSNLATDNLFLPLLGGFKLMIKCIKKWCLPSQLKYTILVWCFLIPLPGFQVRQEWLVAMHKTCVYLIMCEVTIPKRFSSKQANKLISIIHVSPDSKKYLQKYPIYSYKIYPIFLWNVNIKLMVFKFCFINQKLYILLPMKQRKQSYDCWFAPELRISC